MAVDHAQFRHALGQYASTVTVVTTLDDSRAFGITVTAFCSLSLEPPLVLICIDKRAHIHDRLRVGGRYAVNFLAADQEHLSRRFAAREEHPFAGVATMEGRYDAPLFQGTVAALECSITGALPGGDHTIFVGQVEAAHVAQGEPLLHFRGQYRRLTDP